MCNTDSQSRALLTAFRTSVAHAILVGSDAVTATFDVPFETKKEHVEFIKAQFAKLPRTPPGPGRG